MKNKLKEELYTRIHETEDMLPHDENVRQEFQAKIKEIEEEMSKPENAENKDFYIENILYLAEEYQWCYTRKGLISDINHIWNQLILHDDIHTEFENIIEKIEAEINKPENIKNEEIYKKIKEYLSTRYKWCWYREQLIDVIKTLKFNFEFNEELRQDFQTDIKKIEEEMSKPENKANKDFYLEHLMGYLQVLDWYEI